MKKVKEEKGSITLFTLMSMIFFVIVLVGLYVNSSYKIQKQEKELQEIQKSYGIENIDDLYNTIAITTNEYTTVTTYDELENKINDENYIVLENDIKTNQYLTINRTITIDLNGYTYLVEEQDTENSSIVITGTNTVLTIKDSSKNQTGSIVTTNTNKNLISIEDGAKVVLENGAICNDNLNNKGTKIINISEDSEFDMNGGTIIGLITQEGIFTMSSGKIKGNIFAKNSGNCSIQGGTINGKVIYEQENNNEII